MKAKSCEQKNIKLFDDENSLKYIPANTSSCLSKVGINVISNCPDLCYWLLTLFVNSVGRLVFWSLFHLINLINPR